jgi:hypothetical protein
MMQGKVLDIIALLKAVAALSVCLAIALWCFAVVRLVMDSQEDGWSDTVSVTSFALQIIVPLGVYLFFPHSPGLILTTIAISCVMLSLVFASRSSSIVGKRMKPAILLWVVGVILNIGIESI